MFWIAGKSSTDTTSMSGSVEPEGPRRSPTANGWDGPPTKTFQRTSLTSIPASDMDLAEDAGTNPAWIESS